MADKLKKLRVYRQNEISRMHELYSIAQLAIDCVATRRSLKVRYELIEDIKDEFYKQQNGILGIVALSDDADINSENKIRETFDNEYFGVKVIYSDLFQELPDANVDNNATASRVNNNSNINLPRIELPKFKGDFKAFPSFIDLFNAVVHNNNALTEIEKNLIICVPL